MIKTIEIMIHNGIFEKINFLLIYDKNICYLDNKKYTIDDEFKSQLLRIIRTWKNEYGTANGMDLEEFTITVNTEDKETFHGKGIFPDNYNSLIELLGGLNDSNE